MNTHVAPLEFMSVVVAYANVLDVSIKDIFLPNNLSQPIPNIKLTSTLHLIQRQWLEQTTGRLWDGSEMYQLSWQIECWIQDNLQFCPEGDNYIVWHGQMWKRGAEYILSLRTKEA